jgi:signal transduction histidine kinase/pSer/pThr/pTyr-binding forkhead associated (FHA) protein
VPRLIVIKGTDEGRQYALTGDVLPAGRDSTSKVRLSDTEVSRRHAEFVRTAEGYRVRDVGSANGTFVNGQSVRDVLLQQGDHVQIGQTVLVFTLDRGEAPPASDLAERISMITRQDVELSSAIVKSVAEGEGSRILANPESVRAKDLGVLYEVTQAISHTLDIHQLLEKIMELIFRSIQADRGCVMLRTLTPADGFSSGVSDPGPVSASEFEPAVVRWREGVSRQEKLPVSRTIMEYALHQRKGVLVSDAARDERFSAVQSLVQSGIREVLCVPMKGRHETLGVLYLDTRTSAARLAAGAMTGKFTEEHLLLASAIAHQAALAVEETRYYQAMVNAERMAAIGQTVAALSHHIKNILQGLRTGGDILEMGIKDKDERMLQQGWRMLQKNQGKVNDLVMDMLSYSKEREPTIEPTNLNQIARDVVELMLPRAREKGIQLGLRLDDSLPVVPADAAGIHHALLNVVGNALDAVEEAPAPQVLVGSSREPVNELSKGSWVLLQVRDNGPGIPAEKLADIFRPFVSSKGARGTGLGLAVSRKILREHGGDILVKSQAGKGSLFSLRLPLRSPLSADAQRTHTELPVAPPPN